MNLWMHPCACLALYDWGGDLDAAQFCSWASDFFSRNREDLNYASIGTDARKDDARNWAELRSKLNQATHVSTLELYHTLPDYTQLVFGWDVTAALFSDEHRSMYLCCDQTLVDLNVSDFEATIESAAREIGLLYGIGFARPYRLGPVMYATGMATGLGYSDQDMLEADRIGSWFREVIGQNRHRTGLLRDLYPLNVISEPHLGQRVGGARLADWIRHSPDRGTLRPLDNGAWLWRVEESQIESVRAPLVDAGLLIAYLPR
jgi:hypothetical protein